MTDEITELTTDALNQSWFLCDCRDRPDRFMKISRRSRRLGALLSSFSLDFAASRS